MPEPTSTSVVVKRLRVPMVPTTGYAPSSFNANLSPKAAQALADLLAGYQATGGPPVNDYNHAINVLLENLAHARDAQG